jgi:hypothetical protein
MKQKALGRKHSEATLFKISANNGQPIYIFEKCDSDGFKLIDSFVSIRKAAVFLGISKNTIQQYKNSGEVFKNKSKFSGNGLI